MRRRPWRTTTDERRAPGADAVEAIIASRLASWSQLDLAERARLLAIVDELVSTMRWEAARGFTLTDEIVVTIAAHAALPVLELGAERYREVSSIIVHPRTIVLSGTRPGPIPGTVSDDDDHLLGMAHHRGPVLLAWDAVLHQALRPGWGEDVVIHEFAHRLDMLDGMVDGTPPLDDPAEHRRWVEVCTAEFEHLRSGEPEQLLRPYAASDPGEFFAVVSEVFFTQAIALAALKPDLYDVLRRYYRQDTAARQRRGAAEVARLEQH